MTGNNKSGPLDGILSSMIKKKKDMEEKLQQFGARGRKNIGEGQKKSFDHSTRINPFK